MNNKVVLNWTIETKELDLKFTWKISRGSTNRKINYFVHLSDGEYSSVGEIAGITKNEASANIVLNEFSTIDFNNINKASDLARLNLSAPVSYGLESALIHLECQKKRITLSEYFNLTLLERVPTSFSLPILPVNEIQNFIQTHNVQKFPVCKVKVGHQHQVQSCLEVARHYNGPIRVDANEAFQSAHDVMQFLEDISSIDLQFLEQPMPGNLVEEYIKLKSLSPIPIVADESLQKQNVDETLSKQFHGINVKLMKSGGYIKAVEQINQAKALDLKVMLGCMVETTVAIYGAYAIGQNVDWFDLDGFLFFKDEPFKLVEEKEGYLYSRK